MGSRPSDWTTKNSPQVINNDEVMFPNLQLLPLVTVENDDEVSKLVKAVCARIAQVELSVRAVPAAISALQKVCT